MSKRKLTPAKKARKKKRRAEFIRRNADPIWLHRNGMWEYSEVEQSEKCEDGLALKIF